MDMTGDAMTQPIQKVGCCGFRRKRAEYLSTFSLVEVQKTFYQPPKKETADRWRDEAPDDFEYALKAWQMITHDADSPTYRRMNRELTDGQKRLVGSFRWTAVVRSAWDETLDIARRLRADKVIFQCPKSLEPTEKNKDHMRKFFEGVAGHGLTCIWEPRGWETADIDAMCQELDLVHCVDPFRDECVTKGLRYYRLHGIGGYKHEYTDDELRSLLERRADSSPTYYLFNNVTMFEDAKRFQEMTPTDAR
jgi:uncharacterized protein YecE (DUF72 family)